MNDLETKKTRKFHMPSAFTILMFLIVIVAILTWIIPAGKYETNSAGRNLPYNCFSSPRHLGCPNGANLWNDR